jgi:ABC-2 type transport system ATP-binding protein
MSEALVVRDLTVTLGGREILKNVGFSLQGGALAALVGPNGSGKSTLLATLAGLHPAIRGEVLIEGHSVFGQAREARRQLGYMVAQDQLPGLLTPRQCLTLFTESRGLDRIPDDTWKQIEALRMGPWLDTWLSECSLGTRQKVSVLLALLGSPPLILLDEPLNALDPISALALKQELTRLTAEAGSTVLMASHDLAAIETLNNHILVLLNGRVVLDWDQNSMARAIGDGHRSLESLVVEAMRAAD